MQSSHARSDDKAATRGQVMSTFTPCRSERVATPYLGWSLDGHDFYGSQSVRPIKEDWEVTVRLLLKGSTCSGTTPIHCLNITYYCLDVPRTCNCAKSASFVALSVKQPSHVHNNKTLQSTGAGATAQRPMLRCWVLPQPSEPKWPAGVRRTLQQNVSTRMFPWTSAPALLTPTQHLSVLHIDSTLQVRTAEPFISGTMFQARKCSKTSLKKTT